MNINQVVNEVTYSFSTINLHHLQHVPADKSLFIMIYSTIIKLILNREFKYPSLYKEM